jgi:hypothetical protein
MSTMPMITAIAIITRRNHFFTSAGMPTFGAGVDLLLPPAFAGVATVVGVGALAIITS